MVDLLGIIGGLAFAVSTVPEVIQAHRTKRCNLTWGMLCLCAVGETCSLIAAIATQQLWLLWNYVPNGIFLTYLIGTKLNTKG